MILTLKKCKNEAEIYENMKRGVFDQKKKLTKGVNFFTLFRKKYEPAVCHVLLLKMRQALRPSFIIMMGWFLQYK